MNNVQLIGNVSRDPELRYSTGENQTAICRFGLAVNEGYGDNKKTSFLNIVVFGKQAENCDKYLSKGSKVAVNGRIQTGSYTNNEGNKVNTFDIVANNFNGIEFLSSKGNVNEAENTAQNEQQSLTEPSGFTALSDGDIPF